MRKLARTRRLSILITVSCVAFLVLAGADVRSFWSCDEWDFMRSGQTVVLVRGCFLYRHYALGAGATGYAGPKVHLSGDFKRVRIPESIGGFIYDNQVDRTPFGYEKMLFFRMPLWPALLFLLFVGPVRWLISRCSRRPAFPIITDARVAPR